MLDVILEALRSAILITGLVVVMMLVIEAFNVGTHGRMFARLRGSGPLQVVVSALLGSVPGCVGGFAAVSLYTHRMLSFGALVAMMIATAGDEAFMMLALFPGKAALLFLVLFCLAIVTGFLIDRFGKGGKPIPTRLEDTFDLHEFDSHKHIDKLQERIHYFSWKRIVLYLGVILFIIALVSGFLEEETPEDFSVTGIILDERWLFWIFALAGCAALWAVRHATDHFFEEHLWDHIICRHLPSIFAWTFGVLLLIGILFHYVDLTTWISDNTALMILLAIAVGLIPQSGPHLVFVTLFASGVIPFPVLLANSIVQDGHASLPLIADSKSAFVKAKAIKVGIALIVFVAWGLLL